MRCRSTISTYCQRRRQGPVHLGFSALRPANKVATLVVLHVVVVDTAVARVYV